MMTRLWIMSDLHLEAVAFPEAFKPAPPDYDVLVVAGDVCEGHTDGALRKVRHLANGKPAVFVLGNHEFWGREVARERRTARRAASDMASCCWMMVLPTWPVCASWAAPCGLMARSPATRRRRSCRRGNRSAWEAAGGRSPEPTKCCCTGRHHSLFGRPPPRTVPPLVVVTHHAPHPLCSTGDASRWLGVGECRIRSLGTDG